MTWNRVNFEGYQENWSQNSALRQVNGESLVPLDKFFRAENTLTYLSQINFF